MPTTHSHANTRQAGRSRTRGPAGLDRATPDPSAQPRSRSDITVGGGDRDNGENVSRTANQGLTSDGGREGGRERTTEGDRQGQRGTDGDRVSWLTEMREEALERRFHVMWAWSPDVQDYVSWTTSSRGTSCLSWVRLRRCRKRRRSASGKACLWRQRRLYLAEAGWTWPG